MTRQQEISLENVAKTYAQTRVLKNISLTLPLGGQYVITGASGSGKSTLLYLLGGIDRPTSGSIRVGQFHLNSANDEQLANFRNQQVGFVFQFHFLLSSMTCWENILLPAQIGGKVKDSLKKDLEHFARELGVEHCLPKYPYQISGGEQQRVNMIRAISLRPKLVLCDEPTGNLDSKNSEKVISLLKELGHEVRSTLILVTHDKKVASTFHHELLMEDGELKGAL